MLVPIQKERFNVAMPESPPFLQPEANPPWPKKVIRGGHKDASCQSGCAIEYLLAQAELVLPTFQALFAHFEEKTPCEKKLHNIWGKTKDESASEKKYIETQNGRILMGKKKRKVTQCAGLKGAPRIEQKCFTKYYNASRKDKESAARYITDVVRGTLAFNSCSDMITALSFIKDGEGQPIAGSGGTYKIARAKQIYEPRSALLYGDVKLNLELTLSSGVRHNCELQLNHLKMIRAKGTSDGHGAYEAWRDMDDEHWLKEKSALPIKLNKMTGSYLARAQKIVHKSHSAYYRAAVALENDKSYKALLALVAEL